MERQDFVLGLDWVGKKHGWAYCRLSQSTPESSQIGCFQAASATSATLITGAARIVIDTPIGLPTEGRVCELRPCDWGARKRLGPRKSTVFPPPVQTELHNWNVRRQSGERQLGGHVRGLLPAIQSALEIREANSWVLESHPELVFSTLADRPLPANANKSLLVGLLARATLLQRCGLDLMLSHFVEAPPITTDNFLDAIAMAVVARDWYNLGPELPVIRDCSGRSERLGDGNRQTHLMALPEEKQSWVEGPPLTSDEVLGLAANFRF